jgi:hypothetical protein
MGPWKKFESTVVRLKRSYEDTGSVVMTMQQVKNINKTDKHIHSHKERYLEVNGEKKTATKTQISAKLNPTK